MRPLPRGGGGGPLQTCHHRPLRTGGEAGVGQAAVMGAPPPPRACAWEGGGGGGGALWKQFKRNQDCEPAADTTPNTVSEAPTWDPPFPVLCYTVA